MSLRFGAENGPGFEAVNAKAKAENAIRVRNGSKPAHQTRWIVRAM